MYCWHLLSLLGIAGTWLLGYSLGLRWVRGVGVDRRVDALVLAAILPGTLLTVAVHLLAGLALGTGWAAVTPSATALVFVLLVAGAHLILRRCPSPTAFAGTEECVAEPLGAWRWPLLIVCGVYAVFALEAGTRYPGGYDALHYHLPAALRWMQLRTLDLQESSPLEAMPENAMIWPFLLSFLGWERLFSLVQLPRAVVCAAVAYSLARALGAGRRPALVTACLVLSAPVVLFQAFAAYVDVSAAGAWLSALLAVLWATRVARGRRDLVILAGLAAGQALGSKMTFLVIVTLLGTLIFGWWAARPPIDGPRWRGAAGLAMTFGLAALVCSAFWFVRATVERGNPFYPLAVRIAGKELLPGFDATSPFPTRTWGERIGYWSTYFWCERKLGSGYGYGVDNGLGAAFAAVVPPGLVVALLTLRRRGDGWTRDWTVVLLLLFLAGLGFLLTCFYSTLRFGLPLVLLGAPLAGPLLESLIRRVPRLSLVLVSTALLVTGMITTFRPLHDLLGRARHSVWSRADFYRVPALINDLPAGTRILNLGHSPDTYPLAGRSLANEVISPWTWQFRTAGQVLSDELLRTHHVDYVFVRDPGPASIPAGLAVEQVFDGTRSQPAWMKPKARLYRVMLEQASADHGS